MSESVTTAVCPNCGAPLEMLPDGTCRWCHAVVAPTGTGHAAMAGKYERLSDSWGNGWALAAPPGSRHAIPWEMGEQLLDPAKDILAVLAAGVDQPGLHEIGASHGKSTDLDFCFCLVIDCVISGGIDAADKDAPAAYLEVCDLLEALAEVHGTDAQWAARARACAGDARAKFGDAWAAAVEGDDPDPFQAPLLHWIARHHKGPGHHFWQH